MYRIDLHGFQKPDLIRELIAEFLPPDAYICGDAPAEAGEELISVHAAVSGEKEIPQDRWNTGKSAKADAIKRELFDILSEKTGIRPAWGILTGVRPVKLCGEIIEKRGRKAALRILTGEYRLHEEKARLLIRLYESQIARFGHASAAAVSLYIGIPFCPTRCLYCSFASNRTEPEEWVRYIEALKKEIAYAGEKLKATGMYAESVYIGGGTPTTLTAPMLEDLLGFLAAHVDLKRTAEYTVEAGRPDTITEEKLRVLRAAGVSRISINPQSMKDETLRIIGRLHSPEDIVRAFRIAREVGFDSINADVIAGLPGEEFSDFCHTLEAVEALHPEDITVHSLAVKRASRLIEKDPLYHYHKGDLTREMIRHAYTFLETKGFSPYYLYRQKHMAGAGENTGFCRSGKMSLYNVRIMDEHSSNLALGAGAISKFFFRLRTVWNEFPT